MTKKLSKIFLKAFSINQQQSIPLYLKAIKKFLLIKDSLQMQRLEWVFGIPQIKKEQQYSQDKYKYGEECIMRINDYAYTYSSTLPESFSYSGQMNCLIDKLLKQRGTSDEFVLKAIKDICSLSIKDETIAKYIYSLPPPSY